MSRYSDILQTLKEGHQFRSIPATTDDILLDLSSNDYMSLGAHCSEFIAEFLERFPDATFTSSASRLLSSNQKYHKMLEEKLASLYGKEALLFNSGYHANVGCISALASKSTLFVCDRLIHASIVDGLKMASANFSRFPHNDFVKLESIIEKEYKRFEEIIIVVESIYSMDGDVAPLSAIIELKKKFPGLIIYLDEAHAFGVRGSCGLGLAEELDIIPEIDIIIGTLGKAAASSGAFVVSSLEMKDFFINTARPFIFSTAFPPANAAWSLLMIEKLEAMMPQREHLRNLSSLFSQNIEQITGRPTGSESQIIPLLTGDSSRAIAIAERLKEKGILALPIRRPTVPPGGERIRFSLCSDMKIKDFDLLFSTISRI